MHNNLITFCIILQAMYFYFYLTCATNYTILHFITSITLNPFALPLSFAFELCHKAGGLFNKSEQEIK